MKTGADDSRLSCGSIGFRAARLLLCGLAAALSLGGCGVGGVTDSLNSAINSINVAIASLNTDSAHWEEIVRGLEDQLPAAENDVKADVDEVLQRGIGAATVSVIATADFMSNRMIQGLLKIKAQITGQPYIQPPPAFISFVPDKIDMARVGTELNSITFYGYDFDVKDPAGAPMKLMLLQGTQLVDVTNALAVPTHYQGVFNLGSNGVPLNNASNQLILTWNNLPISTLPIIQPPPPQPRDIVIGMSSFNYTPPHTHGDADFAGNGPAVHVACDISFDGIGIVARVSMVARETEDDWTEANGLSEWTRVYTPPPGVQILQFLGPTHSEASYVDTNHTLDSICLSPADLVKCFHCVGDTESDNDAGIATMVNVEFNQYHIRVINQ